MARKLTRASNPSRAKPKPAKRPVVDHYMPIAVNLRNARLAAGFKTVSEAARYIGMSVQSAISHEGKGVSFRYPKLDHLRNYARAYNTTIDALEGSISAPLAGEMPRVPIREIPTVSASMVTAPILCTAQAGMWREVDPLTTEPSSWVFTKPSDNVFAANVAGDSMNRIIQDGDVVIVKPWAAVKRDLRNNDVVLVQREHAGTYELTIKTFRDDKLWPESTNPKWRHPIPMRDGDIVTVVGLVVGLYRPL